MNKTTYFLLVVLSIVCLMGCSQDNIEELESSNSNIANNKWVYAQMKHHYLWSDDMPKEEDVDFEQNMDIFYQSIKSPRDRFSYYEGNPNYHPAKIPNIFGGKDVMLDSIYNYGSHKIGYVVYRSYGDAEDILPVLRKFNKENITDLVLDLRYNGGGSLSTAIFISSCIVPEGTRGTDAQYLVYNATVTKEMFGSSDGHTTYKFYNTENLHGADLKLQSVYYLTGSSTASASEATILMTRSHIPTTLIGGRTVGKGVGMYSITSEEYPFTLVPITFRYYDANMNTIPDEGLEPDIEIEDVYPKRQQDIGEITEPLLKKAIECITLNDSDEDSDNTD